MTLRVGPGQELGIGRYELTRHFGLDTQLCAIAERPETRAELLLRAASPFGEERAPLFICPCGDLACGALTVRVQGRDGGVVWSAFGWQTPGSEPSQSPRMERFGPFWFEEQSYRDALAASFGWRR